MNMNLLSVSTLEMLSLFESSLFTLQQDPQGQNYQYWGMISLLVMEIILLIRVISHLSLSYLTAVYLVKCRDLLVNE